MAITGADVLKNLGFELSGEKLLPSGRHSVQYVLNGPRGRIRGSVVVASADEIYEKLVTIFCEQAALAVGKSREEGRQMAAKVLRKGGGLVPVV